MSFENTFCPSPWFHLRITNSGSYRYCRWQTATQDPADQDLRHILPSEYFKKNMSTIRQQLLAGEVLPGCIECSQMEKYGKVSGRQRQLLKVGVMLEHFEPSLASSTFKQEFDYSVHNNGETTSYIQDWQIDLGNYCNSQCVMCAPASSSKLAAEFKTIGLIQSTPPRAWCDDPELLDRFCKDLSNVPTLRYLHFIGGETLITPGFKRILATLVDLDLAKNITVGFTTNLTVWDDSVFELLTKFKNVNIGLSIEALDLVNEYVRYPGKLSVAQELLDRWVAVGQELNWLTQLRITPTCLTIHTLTSVYDYAYKNNLAVESCNFLENPKALRISALPKEIRESIANKLASWISTHPASSAQVVNTRDPNQARAQIVQDAQSYVDYLRTAPDETHLLPELVTYLMKLEKSRGNTIISYLPEYEQLFRSAGYQCSSTS